MTGPSRRRYLACLGTALVGLAGCSGDDAATTSTPDDGTGGDSTGSPAAADETATETATATDSGETTTSTIDAAGDSTETATTQSSDDLDLREANVVDVAVTGEGDGSYRFDVTLHHDDAGEEGYANWWQVETLNGERIGRRELLHAHSEQPFTRSETIEVPSGTTCVVVRGHDETHGYGGQAMLVTVESGATESVQQGEERQSFADATCPPA